MSDNGDNQVHVVFVGRKSGIYFTSKKAFEQVNQLNGSFHGAYENDESVNVSEKGKQIATVPTRLALDTSSAVFISQDCMEKLLKKLCFILKLGQPVFTLHDVPTVNRVQYRRYCVSVEIWTLGDPIVSVGKFAKHDYDAREDVAVLLAEELCNRTGKQIRDYNFYVVQKLETKVEALKDDNLKLTTQLDILREATNKSNSCTDDPL